MNFLDIILVALLLFAFIRGLIKGFFVEIASLVALIAGVFGALHFSDFAADFLREKVSWDDNYISLTAFSITFIIIVITITMLGKALTKIASFAFLGWLNKLLGGIFALLKSVLILSIVLLLFSKVNNTIPFVENKILEESYFYEPIKEFTLMIYPTFLESIEVVQSQIDLPEQV